MTFGALDIAESNFNVMLNWLYCTKSTNPSHELIQDTILKELIDNIVGPNDLLREQVTNYIYSYFFNHITRMYILDSERSE